QKYSILKSIRNSYQKPDRIMNRSISVHLLHLLHHHTSKWTSVKISDTLHQDCIRGKGQTESTQLLVIRFTGRHAAYIFVVFIGFLIAGIGVGMYAKPSMYPSLLHIHND